MGVGTGSKQGVKTLLPHFLPSSFPPPIECSIRDSRYVLEPRSPNSPSWKVALRQPWHKEPVRKHHVDRDTLLSKATCQLSVTACGSPGEAGQRTNQCTELGELSVGVCYAVIPAGNNTQ